MDLSVLNAEAAEAEASLLAKIESGIDRELNDYLNHLKDGCGTFDDLSNRLGNVERCVRYRCRVKPYIFELLREKLEKAKKNSALPNSF